MKRYFLVLLSLFFCAFVAAQHLFVSPAHFPPPVYDFSQNPLTESRILLGRNLFYEPALSQNGSTSCESCHSPYSAFAHTDHPRSHGIHDSIGSRNAPALINLAWQSHFMWDGAIHNLDMQSLAPISHIGEMGSSLEVVVAKMNNSPKYRTLFFKAYNDSVATGERTLKAISQFMVTLVSANSKYDKVLRGEIKFTAQEESGYLLFQKSCASCHTEPLFTNGSFENNGLPADPVLKDAGRAGITGERADSFKFKVPTLRNIEYTYPYMHDGRFGKLAQVLRHYTQGISTGETVARQLQNGIPLTDNEKVDIIAFLLTLSDKEAVFNTNFQFPR